MGKGDGRRGSATAAARQGVVPVEGTRRKSRVTALPLDSESQAPSMRPADFGTRSPIPFFFRIVYLSNNYRDPLLRTIEHEFGLTRPEFSILICLRMRDGLSAIDISGITAQPQNTVGRGVSLLLKKDMITKTADSSDGRRYYLHLAKKGERAYQSFIGLLEDADQRMIACLTPREIERLNSLLDKMCTAVTPLTE